MLFRSRVLIVFYRTCFAILRPPWAILGHLGAILGPSWGHLEATLGHLGPSWSHPGAIFGPPSGHLRATGPPAARVRMKCTFFKWDVLLGFPTCQIVKVIFLNEECWFKGDLRATFGRPSGNLRATFGRPSGHLRATFGRPARQRLGFE